MTCKEIAELLMAYCDEELPKESYEIICEHVLLCGSCQNYVDSYKITIKLGGCLPMTPVPQHLLDKIKAVLKEQEESKSGD